MSDQYMIQRKKNDSGERNGDVELIMRYDGSKVYVAGDDKEEVEYWESYFNNDFAQQRLRSSKQFFSFFGSNIEGFEIYSDGEGQEEYLRALIELEGKPSFVVGIN